MRIPETTPAVVKALAPHLEPVRKDARKTNGGYVPDDDTLAAGIVNVLQGAAWDADDVIANPAGAVEEYSAIVGFRTWYDGVE